MDRFFGVPTVMKSLSGTHCWPLITVGLVAPQSINVPLRDSEKVREGKRDRKRRRKGKRSFMVDDDFGG